MKVVDLGFTAKESIKKATILSGIALFVHVLIRKWLGSPVGFPIIVAVTAGILTLL